MVELADTLDLGSNAKACRFKSCQAHQTVQIRTQYQSVKGSDLSFFMTIRTLMQNTKIKFRRLIFMKTELNNIGTWGRLHYDFLYRNQRSVINAMRLKGTLHDYLMGIDKDAEDMFNLIVKQTAEIEGVTEQLKAVDQMQWSRRMNSIRSRAREFVLKELIYQ